MSDGPSVFARYIEDDGPKKNRPPNPKSCGEGRSRSSRRPIQILSERKTLELDRKLLARPTITLRDIRAFGPNCIRDQRSTEPDQNTDRIRLA